MPLHCSANVAYDGLSELTQHGGVAGHVHHHHTGVVHSQLFVPSGSVVSLHRARHVLGHVLRSEGCVHVPQKVHVHVCVQYVLQVDTLELLVPHIRTARSGGVQAPRAAGAGARPPLDTPHPLELPRRLLQGLHSLRDDHAEPGADAQADGCEGLDLLHEAVALCVQDHHVVVQQPVLYGRDDGGISVVQAHRDEARLGLGREHGLLGVHVDAALARVQREEPHIHLGGLSGAIRHGSEKVHEADDKQEGYDGCGHLEGQCGLQLHGAALLRLQVL
mmetsp:Transcript_12579/g.27933  ORF Transcript_12579/g.27933 Transcript_12579/m.27933 type:complete len:276 (-) Transcript_12579:29-856(-)